MRKDVFYADVKCWGMACVLILRVFVVSQCQEQHLQRKLKQKKQLKLLKARLQALNERFKRQFEISTLLVPP